ncbi:PREDICTED: hepatocyte nuclear factor 1-beta-A-like [Branchiostoma belcheri]|uniref:Hepatocyte nuclear factor 1-beta-A-like n=1 Tax=Branchiostoma belcheri TaxID=7741 RepID=A0A6P4YPZ5_BRABE|nr:PREDICTED: hepatocyte nuclear factor 1-beta-A-like [Branchiostoma belcheri]
MQTTGDILHQDTTGLDLRTLVNSNVPASQGYDMSVVPPANDSPLSCGENMDTAADMQDIDDEVEQLLRIPQDDLALLISDYLDRHNVKQSTIADQAKLGKAHLSVFLRGKERMRGYKRRQLITWFVRHRRMAPQNGAFPCVGNHLFLRGPLRGPRKRRFTWPAEALTILEKFYETNPYPTVHDYQIIIASLGPVGCSPTPDQVRFWYQNRRRKDESSVIVQRRKLVRGYGDDLLMSPVSTVPSAFPHSVNNTFQTPDMGKSDPEAALIQAMPLPSSTTLVPPIPRLQQVTMATALPNQSHQSPIVSSIQPRITMPLTARRKAPLMAPVLPVTTAGVTAVPNNVPQRQNGTDSLLTVPVIGTLGNTTNSQPLALTSPKPSTHPAAVVPPSTAPTTPAAATTTASTTPQAQPTDLSMTAAACAILSQAAGSPLMTIADYMQQMQQLQLDMFKKQLLDQLSQNAPMDLSSKKLADASTQTEGKCVIIKEEPSNPNQQFQ